jgi:hypothetical protein
MDCPHCCFGHPVTDIWATCAHCRGTGRTWIAGAPLFGCKITLGKCKIGEIATLGNGDRGRILRHNKQATPTTALALISEWDGAEDKTPTSYPSCVGVICVSDPRWFHDTGDHAKEHLDETDPMRRKAAL